MTFLMPSSALPPGPGLLATFDFIRNPFRFLDACARRYRDWFIMRAPDVASFVFTSDPAAVREVFLGDADARTPAKRIARSVRSWASGRRCSSMALSICGSAAFCCQRFMASE
jgi:cytochrome P450